MRRIERKKRKENRESVLEKGPKYTSFAYLGICVMMMSPVNGSVMSLVVAHVDVFRR